MAGIDGSVDSGSKNFFIPEFGVNWKYSPTSRWALTVYGNGGMNTDYPGGQISVQSACGQFRGGQGAPYNLLCGSGDLGVDLTQLIIAPYASWQFTKGHSIGIAPLIAYQRFKAEGMQAFDNPASRPAPGNVTNNGYSDSWGVGVRVGYMGQFTEQFSVGVAYSTKISMGEFDRYKGLFAEGGGFDLPSNFTIGVAFRPTKQWLLAARLRADLLRRRGVGQQPQHTGSATARRRRWAPASATTASAAVPARASAGRTSTSGRSASSTSWTRSGRSAAASTTRRIRSSRRTSRSTSWRPAW